jgi:hypothetical protein
MLRIALAIFLFASLTVGCNDEPTTVRVANGYQDGGTVLKVWWLTTLLDAPVAAADLSKTERAIPGSDVAYALFAPAVSPAAMIALRSKQPLRAAAHELLTIEVSDDLFAGNCAAGQPLTDDEARSIVESIFPGDFAGVSYDAASCTRTPVAGDAAAAD